MKEDVRTPAEELRAAIAQSKEVHRMLKEQYALDYPEPGAPPRPDGAGERTQEQKDFAEFIRGYTKMLERDLLESEELLERLTSGDTGE